MAGPVGNAGGVCPYLCGFINTSCSTQGIDGLILTTACDQMRHAGGILEGEAGPPFFMMNVPATWTAEARGLYKDELTRLGRFLEELGGSRASQERLAEVMVDFDCRRRSLLAARETMPPRAFSAAIAAFPGEAPSEHAGSRTPTGAAAGIPVALLGGPLSRADLALFDMIAAAGGDVVLDATETGIRTLPALFRRDRLARDPLGELADAYFEHMPDVARRPNSRLYEWLEENLEQNGIRGVILLRWTWCDLWHAEVRPLRDRLAIPLLDIDLNGEDIVLRNSTRIQAFLEALR